MTGIMRSGHVGGSVLGLQKPKVGLVTCSLPAACQSDIVSATLQHHVSLVPPASHNNGNRLNL